ncbi:uncharacterized protein LOC142343186 isoform X2 [Convolutriloba macropyga]
MLELDMMEEKQRYQEESVISAVEVAIEMQRQANVDPDSCSLSSLVPDDDPLKPQIEEQLEEIRNQNYIQKRSAFVDDIAQNWKKYATIASEKENHDDITKMIDDDIDTADTNKCWHLDNRTSSVIINFNQVLVIRRVVLYTGQLNLDPTSILIVPLETMDPHIIRLRDKAHKYAMSPKRKADEGTYILDLETNIRSTRVFQYLEIAIRPWANSKTDKMVLCEIDLQYSDNYLASVGLTEYYQPPIRLKASLAAATTALLGPYVSMTQLVERLYDDDNETCSEFTKLKILIDAIVSTHIYKQLSLKKLVFEPKFSSHTVNGQTPSPSTSSSFSVLRVSSFDGVLNQEIVLNETRSVDLDPSLSLGDNVITIEDSKDAKNGFTLCELKLKVAVDPDGERLIKQRSNDPVQPKHLREKRDISHSDFSNKTYANHKSDQKTSKSNSAQQGSSYSTNTDVNNNRWSSGNNYNHHRQFGLKRHYDEHGAFEYGRQKRQKRNLFHRSYSEGGHRGRRDAEPYQPKSKFALMDDSAELKATITLVMEQLTMVTLLFIRWIIPRSRDMSKEQLATTLGGWMGMMADQLNFLVLLDEEPVFSRPAMTYTVLTIFSFSQLQFCLVYTARIKQASPNRKTAKEWLFTTFLWTSVCILFLQDIPFVLIRCYCVFKINVVNHTVAYFIGKNFIVIMLQLYRILVVFSQENWFRSHDKGGKKVKSPEKKVSFTNGNLGNLNRPANRKSLTDYKSMPWIDDEDEDQVIVNVISQENDDMSTPMKLTPKSSPGYKCDGDSDFDEIDQERALNAKLL